MAATQDYIAQTPIPSYYHSTPSRLTCRGTLRADHEADGAPESCVGYMESGLPGTSPTTAECFR
ncbi:hypothetical protein A2U01_0116119 [Trifolium medium]|uniref:Uncharacterized protein n=1 Tax=Trifolium medium TaxID=97028 RepID=A0A392W6Q0_9FABA|nr:hypothetical protein [Trifolium medium]